ncbi:MAG TPA: hypothetical protein VNA65_02575 [Candidatus Dormibacteraeota bacterium]|nr:hypothetical protein [Candidatus Dormibacteraeota bacterium]
MDLATLVVDLVIVLWFAAVIVGVIRALLSRQQRLAPLPADVRSQYVEAWGRVARQFLYSPVEATRQADVLVSSMLRARGHSLDYQRLPSSLRDARRKRINGEEHHETEALRQALIRYRDAFDESIGAPPREQTAGRRPEMA